MNNTRLPVFEPARGRGPVLTHCIKFKQGFSFDFFGQQAHSVLDEDAQLAFSFTKDGILTCIEVMQTVEEMDKARVLPGRSADTVSLKLVNPGDLSENFQCELRFDCNEFLCEAKFSERNCTQSFRYGPATLELAIDGELCRIVFSLREIEWEQC